MGGCAPWPPPTYTLAPMTIHTFGRAGTRHNAWPYHTPGIPSVCPLSHPCLEFHFLPLFNSNSHLGCSSQKYRGPECVCPQSHRCLRREGTSRQGCGHILVSSQGCCRRDSTLAQQRACRAVCSLASSKYFLPQEGAPFPLCKWGSSSLVPSISGARQHPRNPAAPALALVSKWPRAHLSFSAMGSSLSPPCLWPSLFFFLSSKS